MEQDRTVRAAVAAAPGGVRPYAEHLAAELATTVFPSKGERTRQRLRIAAAAVLETEGYQGLKVGDICARAEVALGTFYVYFRDKTEIAIDVVMSFIDHLYAMARAEAKGREDFEAVFVTNLFFINAYRANPGLMRCHVQLQSQEPAFRAVWEPRHRLWIETLARSIQRRSGGRLAGTAALRVAAALEGMVFNYIYSAAVTRESLSETAESDAAAIAEMLTVLWYRAVHGRDPAHLAGGWPPAQPPESGRS